MPAPDPFPGYRFYLEIGTQKQAVFTEVSGLDLEMEVQEFAEGGHNEAVHRLPGRTRVGNLMLKGGMTASKEFFNWYVQLATGRIKRQNVSLVMYDVAGKEVFRWNFLNAYPVRWLGPQFHAASGTMAIETLELAHDGLSLD